MHFYTDIHLQGTAAILNSNGTDILLTKQDTLVSGTNIKTINGSSLLGSGDIVISGGGSNSSVDGVTLCSTLDVYSVSTLCDTKWSSKQDSLVSGTNIKTINGNSVIGSGDINITAASLSFFSEHCYFGATNYVNTLIVDNVCTQNVGHAAFLTKCAGNIYFGTTYTGVCTLPCHASFGSTDLYHSLIYTHNNGHANNYSNAYNAAIGRMSFIVASSSSLVVSSCQACICDSTMSSIVSSAGYVLNSNNVSIISSGGAICCSAYGSMLGYSSAGPNTFPHIQFSCYFVMSGENNQLIKSRYSQIFGCCNIINNTLNYVGNSSSSATIFGHCNNSYIATSSKYRFLVGSCGQIGTSNDSAVFAIAAGSAVINPVDCASDYNLSFIVNYDGSILIKCCFYYANGTHGAGKVLTSDANGLASWVVPATSSGGSAVVDGVGGNVGLVQIVDGSTGYRLAGDILSTKGSIGLNAIDLSTSGTTSTIYGARGYASVAIGCETTACGALSFAGGYRATANGSSSFVFGCCSCSIVSHGAIVLGPYSVSCCAGASSIIGFQNTANNTGGGSPLFIFGKNNNASYSDDSYIVGANNTISGAAYSTVIGDGSTTSSSQNSYSFGQYNCILCSSDNALAIGAAIVMCGGVTSVNLGFNIKSINNYRAANIGNSISNFKTTTNELSALIGHNASLGSTTNKIFAIGSSATELNTANKATDQNILFSIDRTGNACICSICALSGFKMIGLPTTNPGVAGALWNNNGVLSISAG